MPENPYRFDYPKKLKTDGYNQTEHETGLMISSGSICFTGSGTESVEVVNRTLIFLQFLSKSDLRLLKHVRSIW